MKPTIFIAGAGGIGRAAALIILQSSHIDASVILGDASQESLNDAKQWLQNGTAAITDLECVLMPRDGIDEGLKKAFKTSSVLLDCLPGSLAPTMAGYCIDFEMHYANLTEYVAETEKIQTMAQGAETGFILQTGLAPGYIDLLGIQLYQRFKALYKVSSAKGMKLRVGALSQNASSPHYYAFTWSPIGVATEYIKDSIVVHEGQVTTFPSLSETETLILNGNRYEADFTSGGVADLPQAFQSEIDFINYKTIRFPGHYSWVKNQLKDLTDNIQALEQKMLSEIPMVENDLVIIYAEVYGHDRQGTLRSINVSKEIGPYNLGYHTLRAIQSTTATPLVECARQLLQGKHKGVVTQSMLDADAFLTSPLVVDVYGTH